MRAGKILIFILAIALALGFIWWLFPENGVKVTDDFTLRFPSYAQSLSDTAHVEGTAVNVDTILRRVDKSLVTASADTATLSAKPDSARYNAAQSEGRLILPGDGLTYFDPLFRSMEKAAARDTIVRIMYYGDSQIEMDRITSIFRQKLQERFGGSGPSMVPTIQGVATVSVRQGYSGALTRYTVYGDSTTIRARHRRYGPMCQFAQLNGQATFTFRRTTHRYAQERSKAISRVGVLFGKASPDFRASLRCDTLKAEVRALEGGCDSVGIFTWKLPRNVEKGSISLSGSAEIYAICLDGGPGIAVDNDALRGCAGYIFSGIDPAVMRGSFKLLNTKMIVLEFGGNAIGGIYSTKAVNDYTSKMMSQVAYFRRAVPGAKFLFVGPSDMSRSVNGSLVTWPRLEELNDSLRSVCLRNDVAYWDLFNMMGGRNSMPQWVKHNPPLAGPDYIHFTTAGANHVGEMLSKSFLLYYDMYKRRSSGLLPAMAPVPADSTVAQ